MMQPEASAGFDLYLVRSFFDSELCRELLNELRNCPTVPAIVYGQGESGSVDERVRKASRLRPSQGIVERVTGRLSDYRGEVGKHFGMSLGACEEPQFLRYRVGDFFVAHQDGNTGLLWSERELSRKVSVVIFLNRHSEAPEAEAYGGGSLVFSNWRARPGHREFCLSGDAGSLVAFRSETTHEVTPVTHGERYSIVSWYGQSGPAEGAM